MRPGRRYWEFSWTLGTCKLTRTLYNRDLYSESCCLVAGIHQLTCENSVGSGWDGGFIRIGRALYCNDFEAGHQQEIDIDIPGNCKISNQRVCLIPML